MLKKCNIHVKRARGLIIIGAGGHGRVVADVAENMNTYSTISFVDDADIQFSGGIKVIGRVSELLNSPYRLNNCDVFVAIGNYKTRKKLLVQLENLGINVPTLIHPSAVVARDVIVKSGTAIMANAVVNCGSMIGKGVIINTGATVDHDNEIDDFVHLSPGVHLAGTVTVGEGTWIGIGASVINNVSIIQECIIGAGAVVIKDIPEKCTTVGNPAKPIKWRE